METKYILDSRDKKNDGTVPLKVKIYKDRHNYSLISLKIYLLPDQWDGSKIVNHPDAAILNPRLKYYRLNIARELLEADMAGGLPLSEVKERIRIAINGRPVEKPAYFTEYYRQCIKNIRNKGTAEGHKWTLAKIEKFTGGKPVAFSDITVKWLRDFESFMSDMAPNSVWTHFKNIRSILNDAIDEDVTDIKYPFRAFKIKQEKTRKRALTIEQICLLRDYDCEVEQRQYRDIFMLIFYLCGINMVDLCDLKEITSDGYIEYRRAKTGRLYKIKVEPEAMEIIERYRGKEYLLNILDRYKDYTNYRKRLNANLREIGETEIVKDKAGKLRKKQKTGLFPELSSYWARHSWASIAASLDIPKETIAAALGHGGNSVTDIYISFDQKKIDEANRKVIDAVNNPVFRED